MSRVAKSPVSIPDGVEVKINGQEISVKGNNGSLNLVINNAVVVKEEEGKIVFSWVDGTVGASAQAGTARSLVNNMVEGVSKGFERKLQLNGVGYRAAVQGNVINLTLGFSHPVAHALPEGITAECPSNTEIILKSIDKQLIGQVAADIRGYRPPEPYKGKGVRYADENVRRKEAKKK